MTSGNDGYGSENQDAVAAHEIGHIFLAFDQYSSAYQPCTRRSGYPGAENQNSQYGACASRAYRDLVAEEPQVGYNTRRRGAPGEPNIKRARNLE